MTTARRADEWLINRRSAVGEWPIAPFPLQASNFVSERDGAPSVPDEMKAKLGDRILRFVDRGGLALGICNGFQVLVRLGLLPCLHDELAESVTLTHNLSNHYECRWVTLKTRASRCVFLPEGITVRWPAAHGEGRLMTRDAADDKLFSAPRDHRGNRPKCTRRPV